MKTAAEIRSEFLEFFRERSHRVVPSGPVFPQDDPTLLLPQARTLVKELDAGDGVLILTDIYGGTPSNMAAKLVMPDKIEAVAGVSLPMLIRVLNYRDRTLQVIVTKAISGGCEGVLRVPMFKLHNAATGS